MDAASSDFRFASAVVAFGMLLRGSQYKGDASYTLVKQLAENALGTDSQGYRHEFLRLAGEAERLSPPSASPTIAR